MIIHNQEHLEAHTKVLQDETDEIRKKYIDDCSPVVRDNFSFIEQTVRELDVRNLPFLFMVNPHGYDFKVTPEDIKRQAGKGFWRYQKLHGQTKPGTEEFEQTYHTGIQWLVYTTLMFFSHLLGLYKCKIFIFHEDTPVELYDKGQHFNLTKKDNNNED